MSVLLTRVCDEIDARLADLRPAMAEYERLIEAADALDAEARAQRRAAPEPAAKAPRVAKAANPPRVAKAPRVAKPAKARRAASSRAAAKAGSTRIGASEQAIVAALEHGSHTVGELGIVTAMSGAEIRASVKRLLKAGGVQRAKREGRVAYALSAAA
jgi:chromatin segregation and condensation protein Rec8/ScpA/Scc1 (kleisin family)